MRTLVIGCNHRSAPVALRERLAFDDSATSEALGSIRQQFPAAEAVLISTCNRIELYIARPERGQPRIAEAIDFLATFHQIEPADLAESLYSHEDIEAVRHLFRVVSSLDSMVLGESQILGQAKSAFEVAQAAGTVGRTLGTLFPQAFNVAKDIHTHTAIATGKVSVGSTAVDLARQVFSHFDDKTVLMVGAGKMGELTLTYLLATRPKQLLVTNRTDARAVALADRIRQRHNVQAQVVPYGEWIHRLADVDMVISSTGSREPLLTAEQFAPVPARRRYRSLLIIDIAVPRDIDPAVGEQECVFLYNIDDLQTITESTLVQRREAIDRCHEIVEANVIAFAQRQSSQSLGPLVSALKQRFSQICEAELAWLTPKLQDTSEHDRELIAQMLHRVSQKILNDPLHLLHSKTEDAAARVYADTLRAMFRLSTDDDA